MLPPDQPSKLPGQNHRAHGEQTSPAPPGKECSSPPPPPLPPSQYGLRKNRSTEDEVTLLTQDIEHGFHQKMKTLAVFVDLTKAFDKVWKGSLLFKLLRKRVCGNMYKRIQSYLFQRSARVRLDGQTSSSVKIRGVPQGGVISPTLFIIFIDDICYQVSSYIPRALHADDLALWTKAEQVTTAVIRRQ